MNVHFTYCSIVPVYICLAVCSSGPSSICSGLPSDKKLPVDLFRIPSLSLLGYVCSIYIYVDDYTMHLTLVLSFPCSIHRQQWSFVMAELQIITTEHRARRATVELRDQLYATNLLPSFMDHASRWRHVLAELQYTFGYRHNDTVHDTKPESWDDECNIGAAFLWHRLWCAARATRSGSGTWGPELMIENLKGTTNIWSYACQ